MKIRHLLDTLTPLSQAYLNINVIKMLLVYFSQKRFWIIDSFFLPALVISEIEVSMGVSAAIRARNRSLESPPEIALITLRK